MPTKKLTPRQVNAKRKARGLPALNYPLWRKVLRKLETAPLAYRQRDVIESDALAPCGTVGCIGGWAYLLAGESTDGVRQQEILNKAARLLGLNTPAHDLWDSGEAAIVFAGNPSQWPARLVVAWNKAIGHKAEARVAIRYIKHILATGEVR